MEVYPLTLDEGTVITPDYFTWWEQQPTPTPGSGENYATALDNAIKATLRDMLTTVVRTVDGYRTETETLEVMQTKTIDLTDRRTLTLELDGYQAGYVTHIALFSEDWDPHFALYRVTNVLTRTIVAKSVTFELEFDPIGTVTMQTRPGQPARIGGYWDVYHKNLGEPSKPYVQPIGVVKDLSVPLPRIPDWMYETPGIQGPAMNLLFVKVTGVSGGKYETFACLCADDPNERLRVGLRPTYYYPMLREIMNDPQTFTPFPTADSIVDISISARTAVPIRKNSSDPPLDLSASTIYSDWLYLEGTVRELDLSSRPEFGDLKICWTELTDVSYGLSYEYDVPATDNVPWYIWPIVEMDVRDMYGNVLANIDTRWCDGLANAVDPSLKAYDAPTTVSGLKLTTSVTLTNIITSLVFPDGSHIDWPEGHLPYNTSVYKDYLATQQRYDREMLDIAVQQARGQTIVNSSTSLVNGLLTGALSGSGPLGAVTAAVGVVGNIAQLGIRSEAMTKELEAKQAQLQLMPDKTYIDAGNIEYMDGYTFKLEGKAVDMIAVKLPIDAWRPHPNGGVLYEERYVNWFIRHGYYAGGRYASLDQGEFIPGENRFVKISTVTALNLFRERGNGANTYFPSWLQREFVDLIKNGVNIRRITI